MKAPLRASLKADAIQNSVELAAGDALVAQLPPRGGGGVALSCIPTDRLRQLYQEKESKFL